MILAAAITCSLTGIVLCLIWVTKGRRSPELSFVIDILFLAATFLYVAAAAGDIPEQIFNGIVAVFLMKMTISDAAKVRWRAVTRIGRNNKAQ